MSAGKDVCSGCEEFRPLLNRFRGWRDNAAFKPEQQLLMVRPLLREEAFQLMRFVKHWPTNPHFVHSHIACLFKSQDDLDALHGVTLSYIMLGIQYVTSCKKNMWKNDYSCVKELETCRQSSTGSSADSLPDHPTPSSEPDSGPSRAASISASPVPGEMVDVVNVTVQPEVIDISSSPELILCSEPYVLSKGSPDRCEASSSQATGESSFEPVLDFALWPAKDLEDFACFYHRIFLPIYPLYVAGKFLSQRDDQRNKLDVTTCPPYFLDTFTFWVAHGGLQTLTSYFASANAENSNLTEALFLVTLSFHVRHFVYFEIFTNSIATFRINVINYLLSLPLEEFRKPTCRSIAEIMWSLRKDSSWPHATFDLEGLNLAHKFFSCSSHLALRLIGIQEINQYIGLFHDIINDLDHRLGAQLGNHLAHWVLEKHIVEEIFGQNAHVELISRSAQIINFLSNHQCLSIDQLDFIWNAAQMNYISRHVFEMLPNITRFLEPTLLMHLYKRLSEMDVTHHTEQSINVIATAIRTIWYFAINQKPPTGSSVKQNVDVASCQSSSQDHAVIRPKMRIPGTGEPLYRPDSGGSSTDGTSGTTGSGSDEDSDSNCFDSDEDEGVSGASKIPEIATLYRGHPNGTKLNPQSLQLRLANVAVAANGGIQVTPMRPPSSEEGSDESDEDGEDDDDDEDVEELSEAHAARGSFVLNFPGAEERRKRSPCPSRESSVPQKKFHLIAPVVFAASGARTGGNNSAIMEHLLSPAGKPRTPAVDTTHFPQLKQKYPNPLAQASLLHENITDSVPYNKTVRCSELEDDVMTQGSDCEVNSSTSDMSGKVQDLDVDLEGLPDADLADEEDDLEVDLPISQSTSMLINEEVCRNKALQMHANRFNQMAWRKEISYNIDDATKPGKTLLWDLIQEPNVDLVSPIVLNHAEKELAGLIVNSNNQSLAMNFVDACVQNLVHHRAVCVSLRILTKLIQAYHNNRAFENGDIQMLMQPFFNDLQLFADKPPENELNRAAEIRVRLNFLQTMYSNHMTDKKFRLSEAELQAMWDCFVVKLKMIDELSQWFLQQLNANDSHALSGSTVSQLFYNHLGKLDAPSMTTTALKLYQLCLQNLTTLQTEKQLLLRSECADRVWKYAMFGDADVSEQAIRHLNNFYIQAVKTHKDSVVNFKEEELFSRSMAYITEAMAKLDTNIQAFGTITRCFSLMRKQIESYKQRYGFHLRLWQLAGCGVLNHNYQFSHGVGNARACCFIHATFQVDDRREETTITMLPGQYFGELRGEVLAAVHKMTPELSKGQKDIYPSSCLEHLYRFAQNRGSMHITFRNEEISPEKDETTLHELGFRQENHIVVNFGGNLRKVNQKSRDKQPAFLLPPPLRETVPMLLAASPANFEIFFELQERLNTLGIVTVNEPERETVRKQVARNLWEFLMLIPTSESVLGCLRLQPPRDHPDQDEWKKILPSGDAHRLLYALQALENLYRDPNVHGIGIVDTEVPQAWTDRFISSGGFARLYELLLTPQMQESGGSMDVVDYHRECLSTLIRVIYIFSLEPEKTKYEEDSEESSEESEEEEIAIGAEPATVVATRKRKITEKKINKAIGKRVRVESIREGPCFKRAILEMLDTSLVLNALLCIQYNTVMPMNSQEQRLNRGARAARTSVVRLGFEFLFGWAGCNQLVFSELSHHGLLPEWLRRLALESADSGITAETCMFIERMCRVEPEYELSCALLDPLVKMMPVAETIRCLRPAGREDKPPLRPSPRHFYDAISKLLEIIPNKIVMEKVDLDTLCERLANSLEIRPCYEPRHGNQEDDGLSGLLKVATQVLCHGPRFKFSPDGMKLLIIIFNCLFDLPCAKNIEKPKCKSAASRASAYGSLFEITKYSGENLMTLGRLLIKHHGPRNCLMWDYWPRDETRADCGYVGIMNLGATCYIATTLQHLYMIPEARRAILEAVPTDGLKQGLALHELQRMFAFLLCSERKAYSPEAFCRVYEMNNQTLNPTEQKDMMEFFSDLVAKMEEMSPTMKQMVKRLFTGTNCNTVVSLDCGHVSQTTEDFTTVRCQVNNMRNLYESLNDVCVKDVLEGNNMYKCSQCNREVRAEKRVCFRSLPEILVLNTLRYTFNMITMQREKVNTLFSFPTVLDMSSYMEENIYRKRESAEPSSSGALDQYKYELIGVTVHTGTAEGGHYYSFIRDLESGEDERWYLFNDVEVRQFDPDQLGPECFGGDQPKQPFEHAGERYLDFGLEKTNSAYMLFYERVDRVREQLASNRTVHPTIPKDLQQWVTQDTTNFVNDLNIFDRYYFDFLWKLCSSIPQTIPSKEHPETMVLIGQLGTSFLWETLIHARDRSHFTNFFELTSKLAVQNPIVADWFFRQMVDDNRWLYKILIQCPISNIRYMFQRYIVTFVTKIRPIPCNYFDLYAQETPGFTWQYLVGRFCRQCISYLNETDVRHHWRNLTDLMHILVEFSKLGWAEAWFLTACQLFTTCYHFYSYVRQLKDIRSTMMGPLPLFPLHANILEMAMLGNDEPDVSDRFSPEVDKDKPNTLSLMVSLLRSCIETFQSNVFSCKQHQLQFKEQSSSTFDTPQTQVHSDIDHFMGNLSGQEQLEFVCDLIRDGIEPFHAPRLAALLYFDKPEKARFAVHYLVQKVLDLSAIPAEPLMTKKERDRELQIRSYLNAVIEMVKGGGAYAANLVASLGSDQVVIPEVPQYMDYLLEKVMNLVTVCPVMTYQWLSEHSRTEPLRKWVLKNMDFILEWHGLSVGKPPSGYVEELQMEVSRLIVSLTGEVKFREIFCSYQNGLLLPTAKEKHANAITASEKIDLRPSEELHELIKTIVRQVLGFFERVQLKHPTLLSTTTSAESYQWILYAIQFLMVDKCEKMVILDNYDLLRKMLMAQLSPEIKHGGNRQGLLQLFAAASNRCAPLCSRIIEDQELLDALLTEFKPRGNEDTVGVENEARYTGAVFLLLNSLCLQNGAFALEMSQDPRLLSKMQFGMSLRAFERCSRPLTVIIGSLINSAPYPDTTEDKRTGDGEVFRRTMFGLIMTVRAQWPTSLMILPSIARKVIEGCDEEFTALAIESKMMDMLLESFRAYYTAYGYNKTMTYMYEEAQWNLATLKKFKQFATLHAETNPLIRDVLTTWVTYAKQVGRDMGVDIIAIVDGNTPFDLSARNIVPQKRR